MPATRRLLPIGRLRRGMHGAALTEMIIIGVPLIMFLTLGMVQLILIGHARVTLNHAALLGARQGALYNAEVEPMRSGLATGLAPMFGASAASDLGRTGGGDVETYALPEGQGYRALAAPQGGDWRHPANPIRSEAAAMASNTPDPDSEGAREIADKAQALAAEEVERFGRITIMNPTTQAFTDFAREIRIADGEVGIPNAGLYRMTGEGTRETTVEVCEQVATPTVEDTRAPLQIETPSKSRLKDALLDGVADSSWDQDGVNSDTSQVGVSERFKNRISDMIDDTDLSDSTAAVDLYNRIQDEADQFVSENAGDIPSWQIEQVGSVSSMADILAQSTAGAYRPSESDIRDAVGPSGGTRHTYLDYGSSGLMDEWDEWTCGHTEYNQSGQGCAGGESNPDSLWGSISDAFENEATDINYADLSTSIADRTAEFEAGTDMSSQQRDYVNHVQSFFEILGESRELGPYRNDEECEMETVTANAPPAVGAASGVNIQDANLLKIHVVYGYKLIVPFVGPAIADVLRKVISPPAGGAYPGLTERIYEDGRIPLTATAVVRMQSPAFENDAMLSRGSGFFSQ